MAYTEEDLTTIQNAIVSLAGGERVVEVTIKNKRIRYGEADLDKLQSLEKSIISFLEKPRFFRVQTGTGL